MSQYIVGLTGGIGSGKSTIAQALVDRGAGLVDTDAIAHRLTAPGGDAMPALTAAFGPGIATPEGALNRPQMRRQAFADPGIRQRLEAILHPLIRRQSLLDCESCPTPYVLLAVPLLVESGSYRDHCNRILVVDCPEALQVARVVARNGLPEADVRRIMATQASRAARLAVADDVITNDEPLDRLVPRLDQLHAQYLSAAAKKPHANC